MWKIQWKRIKFSRADTKSFTPRSGIQDSTLVFLWVPSGSGDPDSSSSAACGFPVRMVPLSAYTFPRYPAWLTFLGPHCTGFIQLHSLMHSPLRSSTQGFQPCSTLPGLNSSLVPWCKPPWPSHPASCKTSSAWALPNSAAVSSGCGLAPFCHSCCGLWMLP